jgi:calcium-dependent protein kinase
VQKGELRFPDQEWKFISEKAKNFLRNTIRHDSQKRYSAAEALEDPWMQSIQQDEPEKPLAVNVLNNLRDFRMQNKLAQASWLFISSFLSTKEEKAELMKIFKALDTNGDGIISKEELRSGYAKFLGKHHESDVQMILDSIDVNKSGAIDYSG